MLLLFFCSFSFVSNVRHSIEFEHQVNPNIVDNLEHIFLSILLFVRLLNQKFDHGKVEQDVKLDLDEKDKKKVVRLFLFSQLTMPTCSNGED